MENTRQENKKVTIRTAPNFGYQLASNFAIRLEKENIPPSRWPARFPITIKQVTSLPEVGRSQKIARKIIEAAKAMWQDMRESALEIEKDMKLHPELYEMLDLNVGTEPSVWRQLSIELEQIAGNVFVTEFESEETAKASVYKMFSAPSLKKYIVEFEDDYKNFLHEVREAVRATKKILPSIRLELICLLGTNTVSAQKSLLKAKKAKAS